MALSGVNISRKLIGTCLALFAFGLLFRAVFYSRMYIAPGDPYGLADIIEFVLGWALLGLLGISGITALVLGIKGPRQNRVASAWLVGVVVAIALLLIPLHNLAGRWAV